MARYLVFFASGSETVLALMFHEKPVKGKMFWKGTVKTH